MHQRYPEPVYNYFAFAFDTGLRTSELIALTWGQIDWANRTVKVDRARVRAQGKGTKTNRVREVDLTDTAMAALTRQKAHTFMRGSSHPVFNNPVTLNAWPNDREQRETYFHPALRALGIRTRDAYSTRHTFATVLLMAGVNPAYIARQLGHTTTAMLFKHYAKWIDGADKGRERERMNQAFARKPVAIPGAN